MEFEHEGKPITWVGAALTVIIATVALAEKLSVNKGSVPVPFLARVEERGEFIRCTARNAIVAGVLAYARTRLEITPDEEPAWNRFTQGFQQALKPIDSLCGDSAGNANPPNTLSGLMGRKERSTEVMLEALKAVRAAVSELESSLTSDQRQRLMELVPLPRK
jgi:hypothetical protein